MSAIALIVPRVGMGVFTGTFSMAVLLISPGCIAATEVPVFIPEEVVLSG